MRAISYSEILAADELLTQYSAECSIPEIGTPDPQREIYARMEASGLMACFGVFDGTCMVGFASILTCILPHYGKKMATVESLFLEKSYRRGRTGRNFMEMLEGWARSVHCAGMLYNARAGSGLERLLGKLPKYKRTNSVFLWTV